MRDGNAIVSAEERAKRNHTAILQRLASVGQASLAKDLGCSEATISRWKSEQAEQCAKALATLGLKVVPIEMRCYPPKVIGAILELAKERLAEVEKPEELAWD